MGSSSPGKTITSFSIMVKHIFIHIHDLIPFDLSTEMLLPDYDDDQTLEDEEVPEGESNFGNEIEELAKVWSYPDFQ